MSVPPDRHRVRALFEAACDLPAHERESFLDHHCADDAPLRSEVLSLLKHDAPAADILSEPRLGAAVLAAEAADNADSIHTFADLQPGRHVGNYILIRCIGAGGMGEVFEAQQQAPQRRVALKFLHSTGSREIARRFRREGLIQARLNHPGIAQIYETGVFNDTGRGLPFFAMEYVDGPAITAFAREQHLSITERVVLLAQVCDAVAHAHQRGVIHRDLKPDNILVESTPAGPRPKVLDFGVAKLTAADNAAATLATSAGQIVGTLAYMSPEQVSGHPDAADTTTDIYALGLILYELLSGQPARKTVGLSMPQAIRLITEADPPRLASAHPHFRGDLDTIVHKALAREKPQRYAAASELAADIRRHLANEPIAAHPPSAVYQLRKFAKRNRGLVAAVLAIATLLVVSSVVTTMLAVSQSRAVKIANQRTAEAEDARRNAEATSAFLESTLASVAPSVALGQDTTMLRGILDRAAARARAELQDYPSILARLLTTIGATYRDLGDLPSAQRDLSTAQDLRRAIAGPITAESLETAHQYALLLESQSRFADALAAARTNADARARLLGEDAPATLESRYLIGVVLDRIDDPGATPHMKGCLARMESVLGRADHRTLDAITTLAASLERDGRWDDALALKKDLLDRATHSLGENHPTTMSAANNLAVLYQRMGRIDLAEQYMLGSLEARRRVLGPSHPQTLNSVVNLANLYALNHRPDEALPLANEAVHLAETTLDPGHFRTGHALRARGLAYKALDCFDQAQSDLLRAESIFRTTHGERSPLARATATMLADLLDQRVRSDPDPQYALFAAAWRAHAAP